MAALCQLISFTAGFLLLLAVTSQSSIVDYMEVDDVILLNATNFDNALKEFKHLFVHFHAPWSTHCKALAPEFSKLAQLLEEDNSLVTLAKVDATVEKQLAERYKVAGYPTLKLFRDGDEDPVDCRAELKADALHVWLTKKITSPVTKLDSVNAAQTIVDESVVSVIGFFKDLKSESAQTYEKVADSVDDIVFGITDNEDLFKQFNITADNAVVVFKKFDEARVQLTGNNLETFETVRDLVEHHRMPLVIEFSGETAPKIFRRAITSHLLLFISKAASYFEKKLAEFRQIAEQYRGKLLFIYVDVDPEEFKRILEFFGLKRSSCPTYRLIQLEGNLKYKPDSDELSADELQQFIEHVLSGERKPHLMSEPIPKDWDSKPVLELVGLNFNEVVRDTTKNVIVEFYAPWCEHCKSLAPVWEKLGEKYSKSSDVIVAKIDATSNEVEDVKITSFPTILFYRKDSKEPITLPNEFDKTFDHLVEFIKSGGHLPESEVKEEQGHDEHNETNKDEL